MMSSVHLLFLEHVQMKSALIYCVISYNLILSLGLYALSTLVSPTLNIIQPSLRNRLEARQGNAFHLFDRLCGLGSVRPDILSQQS